MATAIKNQPALWQKVFPRPHPADHKYDRGYIVMVAGQLPGAIHLASYAARRMGTGMVRVLAHEPMRASMRLSPGTVIEFYRNVQDLTALLSDSRITAYLYGPGVTTLDAITEEVVFKILSTRKPCLLDAGAITAFEKNPDTLFDNLHADVVLTPHEAEFRRTFKWWKTREESLERLSAKIPAVMLLKGPQTLIAQGGEMIVQSKAPDNLATAGTGDVLAGFIGSLLSRKMPPLMAAAAGVHFHAKCASTFGYGMIAEDLPDALPKILTQFLKK